VVLSGLTLGEPVIKGRKEFDSILWVVLSGKESKQNQSEARRGEGNGIRDCSKREGDEVLQQDCIISLQLVMLSSLSAES